MRVLLLQNVRKIGQKDQVVEVSEGYARNYLIARGLAKAVTPSILRDLKSNEKETNKRGEEEKERLEILIGKIEESTIVLEEKTNDEGVLFGSVDSVKIKKSLQDEGLDVKELKVILPDPIKRAGEYSVDIKFPYDLRTKLKIVIQ